MHGKTQISETFTVNRSELVFHQEYAIQIVERSWYGYTYFAGIAHGFPKTRGDLLPAPRRIDGNLTAVGTFYEGSADIEQEYVVMQGHSDIRREVLSYGP